METLYAVYRQRGDDGTWKRVSSMYANADQAASLCKWMGEPVRGLEVDEPCTYIVRQTHCTVGPVVWACRQAQTFPQPLT